MDECNVAAASNFFRVKNKAAFLKWARKHGLTVGKEERDGTKYFSIYTAGEDAGGGWPFQTYDENAHDERAIDIYSELAALLQEDSVAVLTEAGGTDSYSPFGHAVAINSKGEKVRLDLADINAAAKHLGEEIL